MHLSRFHKHWNDCWSIVERNTTASNAWASMGRETNSSGYSNGRRNGLYSIRSENSTLHPVFLDSNSDVSLANILRPEVMHRKLYRAPTQVALTILLREKSVLPSLLKLFLPFLRGPERLSFYDIIILLDVLFLLGTVTSPFSNELSTPTCGDQLSRWRAERLHPYSEVILALCSEGSVKMHNRSARCLELQECCSLLWVYILNSRHTLS